MEEKNGIIETVEWIRRNRNDQKNYSQLFFMFCDDIQYMFVSREKRIDNEKPLS